MKPDGSDLFLITGAARSGTSMVAGVLHASGLDLGGPLVGRSPHNPRGFFEHRGIRQKVLKPLLRELGADPKGQRKLPPRDIPVSAGRAFRLRADVAAHLNGGRGYKDAKVLLTWPVWKAAFPDAGWIIVRRDPKAIVDSCIRTPFMKGRTYKAGWIEWVQDHEFRIGDLKAAGVRFVEIWPDPHEPESFREAIEFAGLRFNAETVAGALDPSAWHIRKGSR